MPKYTEQELRDYIQKANMDEIEALIALDPSGGVRELVEQVTREKLKDALPTMSKEYIQSLIAKDKSGIIAEVVKDLEDHQTNS